MFAEAKIVDGQIVHGTDKNLYVEFYNVREQLMRANPNPSDPSLAGEVIAVTDEKGNCVYRLVPHIRIHTPGNKSSIPDRPVKMEGDHISPSDLDRFPQQWERFQKGEAQKQNGHLLIELGLGDKEIRSFNEYNVHTVEQLLMVPDGLLANITLGARSIRDKAAIWLENRKNEETTSKNQAQELAETKEKLAALEAQIHALLEAQQAPSDEVKKRGRPSTKIDTTPPFPTDQQFL